MCRIFGFRSVILSQVHKSLVSADNALMRQSTFHPDGWGVAYYVAGSPHVIKSVQSATHDSLFRKVSGIVSSETVVAHLRRATVGDLSILNTHPFQYGNWIFAHNGNIRDFAARRDELIECVAPVLRRFILGDTDSEWLFYLFLTHLSRRIQLHRTGNNFDDIEASIRDGIEEIVSLVGPLCNDPEGDPSRNYLSFVLTNGGVMLAHQGGKPLYYSTYKNICSERDTCPSFATECEQPSNTGFVNHLVFSSEPLQGENVWTPLVNGQIVGVDWRMRLSGVKPTAP